MKYTKPKHCARCEALKKRNIHVIESPIFLGVKILANNTKRYAWTCYNTVIWKSGSKLTTYHDAYEEDNYNNRVIPHTFLTTKQKEQAKIIEDYRTKEPCEICKKEMFGLEFNHIIPQVFHSFILEKNPKLDLQIGNNLCLECHLNIFHKYVTPYMPPKKDISILANYINHFLNKDEKTLLINKIK